MSVRESFFRNKSIFDINTYFFFGYLKLFKFSKVTEYKKKSDDTKIIKTEIKLRNIFESHSRF